MFAITRFCYIEVLFHVLLLLGVKKIVCYTEDLNLERTLFYGGSTLLPHKKKILLIILYGMEINFAGLELLKIAIANAGYTDKIKIGMDVAASGMTLPCFDDVLTINNNFDIS